MIISLNEHEEAEEYLDECLIDKNILHKLRVIARFYMDEQYGDELIRKKLSEYISKCGESPTLNMWDSMITTAMKQARKHDAVLINYVSVTKPEMEKIEALKGKQLQRLAFTLLCLAKYRDATRKNNNHWICFEDKEIMVLANLRLSLRKQAELYRKLEDAGYLLFPEKIDSISMQILFSEDGEEACKISDFRNIGYQYLMMHGEPYYECKNCGLTVKMKNPNTKKKPMYCNACASMIAARQSAESVYRLRQVNKQQLSTI